MEGLLDFIRNNDGVWTLFAVFLGASLEYMLPFLPGDSAVLAGSLLILAGSWSFATVYAVAVAGGFVGSLIHYQIGVWMSRGQDGTLRGKRFVEKLTGKGSIERFFEVFRRYGVWVIGVNRMFPGIRSVTFIAAGAARLPIVPTMALGLVSNLIWSAALLLLGLSLGGSWEKIEYFFGVYSKAASIAGVVLVVAFIVVRRVRKKRRMLGSAETHDRV